MTKTTRAGRLQRALRRVARLSYWRRELTTGRVLKPAYFTLMLRWATWLIALLLAMSGTLLPSNRALTPALLGIIGLWLIAQSLYLPVLRASLPPAMRRVGFIGQGLLPLVDRGMAISVAEVVLAGLIIYLTGGWGTPFYLYGLSSVVMPSLLFGYRAALAAGGGFGALYALAVLAQPDGWQRATAPGALDGFIQYTLVPIPFALFTSYLGYVVSQLVAERDRVRQALAEARVLQTVTSSGLRHVADPARFVAETVAQVRRRGDLRAFAIVYQPPRAEAGDDDAPAAPPLSQGFGPVHGLVAAVRQGAPPPADPAVLCLPLRQADRQLGTAVIVTPDHAQRRPFLTVLAGQIATALANAHLYATANQLAAQAERARLAREIHDGIAQSLFMLTLNLEACAELVERDPERLRARLETLIQLARQTLWQTRHYIHDLKPLLQQEHGLRRAIENQVKEFRTVSGLAVELTVDGDEVAAAPAGRQALYRIVQEGLANVFKHAGARQVTVSLTFEPTGTRLTIADDGRGFAVAEMGERGPRGFGLSNMRDRADELGGRFHVASEPGQGTRLEVWLPRQVRDA